MWQGKRRHNHTQMLASVEKRHGGSKLRKVQTGHFGQNRSRDPQYRTETSLRQYHTSIVQDNPTIVPESPNNIVPTSYVRKHQHRTRIAPRTKKATTKEGRACTSLLKVACLSIPRAVTDPLSPIFYIEYRAMTEAKI